MRKVSRLFVAFLIVYWIEVFSRLESINLIIESLDFCIKIENYIRHTSWWTLRKEFKNFEGVLEDINYYGLLKSDYER